MTGKSIQLSKADAEASVRNADDELFAAFEHLSTAVLGLDASGIIVKLNTAAASLLGRAKRTVIGTPAADYLDAAGIWFANAPSQEKNASFSSTDDKLSEGGATAVAVVNCGMRSPLRVRATLNVASTVCNAVATEDSQEQPAVSYLLEAVTLDDALREERDAVEENIRAANAELLRNLGHEIKNPLGGIRGAAQLLEAELENDEDREATSLILEEADRLQHLVDRLLLPYRVPKSMAPVNIHEVLEHVASLLKLEFPSGLNFSRDYDISAPPVWGDRERLTQIFLNIARNAAEAMEKERAIGQAVIAFKTRIARDVLTGGERVRSVLCVDIVDNGPGIPESIRDKIFYPLVTGRADGTGLGLSIVKSFVEEAHGRVSVESEPGRTDFTVLLPFGRGNSALRKKQETETHQ